MIKCIPCIWWTTYKSWKSDMKLLVRKISQDRILKSYKPQVVSLERMRDCGVLIPKWTSTARLAQGSGIIWDCESQREESPANSVFQQGRPAAHSDLPQLWQHADLQEIKVDRTPAWQREVATKSYPCWGQLVAAGRGRALERLFTISTWPKTHHMLAWSRLSGFKNKNETGKD